MKRLGWFSKLSQQQPTPATARPMAWGVAVAAFLLMTASAAVAQLPNAGTQMSIPDGFTAHHTVDLGGHMSGMTGSNAMYDTLVNMQSGPRVLGESFEMRALPGKKHTWADYVKAFGNGFGGDPNNFATLQVNKSKYYEYSGMFRRDRQYFDYDLLGNPGIPSGYSIPISGSTTPYAWPQVTQSPFLFNTVRRMTDNQLTVLPLSKVTFRFGYSQNIFQGPSLTPSGNSVSGSEVILQEYQRNSTDDFTAALDWKPIRGTKLTYEQEVDHYKGDSYFTMAPQAYTVQEADGTKVALLDSYQSFLPYGYNGTTGAFSPASNCNLSSMINSSTILYANPNGGLPIIDPACNVISSYVRYQPTREIFPTEIFRLQSTSIKNVSMNGDVRYTKANMNLPNYYEDFQGLSKTTRELTYSGDANAKREVIAVDYGIVWQATKTISLSDQVNFSNARQPGTAEYLSGTTESITSGPATINNLTGLTSTTVTSGSAPFDFPSPIGTPTYNYFAQKFVVNNATVTWDALPRATFSLTYRYRAHDITEGSPNSTSAQTGATVFTIHENGGILNVALRPRDNWEINGSAEAIYDDNVLTPVAPREMQHYRIHTLFRPKPWATVSGSYNDLERHNNTNNTGAVYASSGLPTLTYAGPLNHVDHSRVVSLATDLMPNEHYGIDFSYAYNDVYTATNICFQGAASVMPGGTVAPAAANSTGQLCYPVAKGYGANAVLFLGRDFENAPTQYASVALALNPVDKIHSNVGYRISAVNGSRLFTDASDVNGTLVSAYQTPFVKVAWTVHPGFVWKAEYDYYGYGEGGPSGAQYCNNNPGLAIGTTGPVPVVPCSSVANTAMSSGTPTYGFTAPRNFHANNVTLGVHYEF